MNSTRVIPLSGSIHLDNLTHEEYWAFREMVCLFLDPKFDNLHVYPTLQCITMAKNIAALLGIVK